jgi:hypothetical protein
MALAKLFRVTDVDEQRWHIAAPTFAAAVERMKRFEGELSSTHDDKVVRSVEAVEDLILGGTREDSLDDPHEELPYEPEPRGFISPPSSDWTFANNVSSAGTALIEALKGHSFSVAVSYKLDALRNAIDIYEQVPF